VSDVARDDRLSAGNEHPSHDPVVFVGKTLESEVVDTLTDARISDRTVAEQYLRVTQAVEGEL